MKILYTGRLINNKTGTGHDYSISRLDSGWIEGVYELQERVMRDMERKDLFAGLTREELKEVLGINGVTVGAFVEKSLMGFYSILFPGRCEYNLGNDLGLPEDLLDEVAHFEGAGVDSSFRGNSLQKAMTRVCINEALKIRKTRYICATVSPYNYPSIDHIFAFKLYIRRMKEKYNGMLRYICLRDLEALGEIIENNILEVDSKNLGKQSELLEDGFVGFEQVRLKDMNHIRFGRLKCSEI